jgi:putative membrane protein insertion efficiency factor
MTQLLVLLVRVYQVLMRPVLAALALVLAGPDLGPRCRYYPSCSDYAIEALHVHGGIRGLGLAVRRIVRCHPWASGGVDLVPQGQKTNTTPRRGMPARITRGV